MKPTDFAIIGVRLTGLAAIVFGFIMALSSVLMRLVSEQADALTADLHLHDTYYVVTPVHYDLVIPSAVGLIFGVLLFVCSRRLGRLISRGFDRV